MSPESRLALLWVLAVIGGVVGVLWLIAWHGTHTTTPPVNTCPRCTTRGRPTLDPGDDGALLWSCPRCGAHWQSSSPRWSSR